MSGVTSWRCCLLFLPTLPPHPSCYLRSFAGSLWSQGLGKLQACLSLQRYLWMLEKGKQKAKQKGRERPGQAYGRESLGFERQCNS